MRSSSTSRLDAKHHDVWVSVVKIWKCNLEICRIVIRMERFGDSRSYSSFSIIRHFLPNRGRIVSALMVKSRIKNCSSWELNPQPQDHHSNYLPTELSHYFVVGVNHKSCLHKSCSIDFRNKQSTSCEVVHETNKTHVRNLLLNRFLTSTVGRLWVQSPVDAIFFILHFSINTDRILPGIWQKITNNTLFGEHMHCLHNKRSSDYTWNVFVAKSLLTRSHIRRELIALLV